MTKIDTHMRQQRTPLQKFLRFLLFLPLFMIIGTTDNI